MMGKKLKMISGIVLAVYTAVISLSGWLLVVGNLLITDWIWMSLSATGIALGMMIWAFKPRDSRMINVKELNRS